MSQHIPRTAEGDRIQPHQAHPITRAILLLLILFCMGMPVRAWDDMEKIPSMTWLTDYSEALNKAKVEKKPLCVLYLGGSRFDESKLWSNRIVQSALRPFVLVRIADRDVGLVQKYSITRSMQFLFINSESENILSQCRGYAPLGEVVKNCASALRALNLPVDDEVSNILSSIFVVNKQRVRELCGNGDVAGLLSYLKPVEKDDLREGNYVVIKVSYPSGLSVSDIVCRISGAELGSDVILPPSGVYLALIRRESTAAGVKIDAPNCSEIQDEVGIGDNDVLLSREYNLERLKPENESQMTGRVTWPDGKPVPGAIIRVCDAQKITQCDEDGQFVMKGVPSGKFQVRGEAPGGEFQEAMTFIGGTKLQRNLTLSPVATVGIRWVVQTREKDLSLSGSSTRSGAASFSVDHSRFVLERGSDTQGEWGSDLMFSTMSEGVRKQASLPVKAEAEEVPLGSIVFFVLDGSTWRTGVHREQESFDALTMVNHGEPVQSDYFGFMRGYPARVGEVFTVSCARRNCYAKIEITAVTPAHEPAQSGAVENSLAR